MMLLARLIFIAINGVMLGLALAVGNAMMAAVSALLIALWIYIVMARPPEEKRTVRTEQSQ